MSLKRVLLFSLCILVLSRLVGCRETEITAKSAVDDEKEYMKLYFNDTEIPVIWEDNQTVQELIEEAGKGDITLKIAIERLLLTTVKQALSVSLYEGIIFLSYFKEKRIKKCQKKDVIQFF